MNAKIKNLASIIGQALLISGVTLSAVFPFSCKVTTEGIEIIGGDYSPPVLEEISVIDERSVRLDFSEKVKLTGAVVSRFIEGMSDSDSHSYEDSLSDALYSAINPEEKIFSSMEEANDGKSFILNLEQETDVGKKYGIYGKVKDESGNSLTFNVSFTGYNSRFPKLIMTEVQSQMPTSTNNEEKTNGIRRTEFVEILALSDGNLSGLELCSGFQGESRKYVFPAVEVKKGEIFVAHLKEYEGGCVSEEGDDLTLASSMYCSDARDLWSHNTKPALGKVTDIIIIKNRITGAVYDAFMYREEGETDWSALSVDYSEAVAESGIYDGSGPEFATVSSEKTASTTFYRKDAGDIRAKVLSGTEIEYPVKSSGGAWGVYENSKLVSPGRL